MRKLNISILALIVLGACSDDNGDKKPCPAKGLGVVAADGRLCSTIRDPQDPGLLDCQDQMLQFANYDCAEPQICFDSSMVRSLNFVITPAAVPMGLSFILSNCSTGNKKLTISKVDVKGDDRCYLAFDFSTDIQEPVLGPKDETLLQVRYSPEQPGEDHAVLEVHSDAQNFPLLRLSACGFGVPKFDAGQDGGPTPFVDLGPKDPTGLRGMVCKDKTNTASCHQ